MKRFFSLLFVATLGGAITIGLDKYIFEKPIIQVETPTNSTNFVATNYTIPVNKNVAESIDFTIAASNTVNTVVHVKNLTISNTSYSIFDFFYGNDRQQKAHIGTGSGVIISPDGYIITNYHVIKESSKLQVTLNNSKTYDANLIGSDPETDIALIKINAEETLPFLTFGNSDQTKIGEWVLAVGNPFNLTSTVTAGIISAKARDLNSQDGNIQSFIQTDAAVNPGNSGGALVNTNGELIGINTAITSQTGSYIGYSFAVPSNIAKKIVEDIMEFGNVQMGTLGIRGQDLSVPQGHIEGINESQGIFIAEVISKSGAEEAGLKSGDIIKQIDYIKITKFSDLVGYLRSKRPNDTVVVQILRDNELLSIKVPLYDYSTYSYFIKEIGISVQEQTKSDKKHFKSQEGVIIYETNDYNRKLGLEGSLLLAINDMKVKNINDVKNAMSKLGDYYGISSIVILNKYGDKERLIFR